MTHTALILFAHGARDSRWAAPFERVQQLTQAKLPDTSVRLAFLELMSPSLPETVAALVAQGCSHVSVVPVFLGQGGHVLRDLPVLLGQVRQDHPGLTVTVTGAVGEDPQVLDAIASYCVLAVAQ